MNKTYNPECDPDYERDPENPNYPESWNVVAGQEEFITENAAGVEFNKKELDLIREFRQRDELLEAAKELLLYAGCWDGRCAEDNSQYFARLRSAVDAIEKPADIVPPDPDPTT